MEYDYTPEELPVDKPKKVEFHRPPSPWTGELIQQPPKPTILIQEMVTRLIREKSPGLYPAPKTVPLK